MVEKKNLEDDERDELNMKFYYEWSNQYRITVSTYRGELRDNGIH